ncbi:hypothetical protein NM688_g1996 [Phlebia brevispora]|uniref:Uncharacterized protein n=1 Tax=Phlebia brevispora TaxID=194682 RepID=A0ACC1TAI4_9APHY|nr:hypothetical protein NM688_g1996 [Phlebia brevispora]
MASIDHEGLVDELLNPRPENAREVLDELGLLEVPSRDQVHRAIEEKLLLPKDKIPAHWLSDYQVQWEHEISIPSLLSFEPSPPPTSLSFVRSGLHGHVTGYVEVPNPPVHTGLTSTSLDRAPGPSNNFVRGKSGYVPFWPGGMEDIQKDVIDIQDLHENAKGLKTVPPGFSRGLRLPGDNTESDEELLSDLQPVSHGTVGGDMPNGNSLHEIAEATLQQPIGSSEIDDLLPASREHLNPVTAVQRPLRRPAVQKRDWAHVVDVNKPMTNFNELVPEMAHKYPFELDTFQKEAVYHLEMGDSVFVAAHTSAGKTVVAEYAIALAQKHMTRAIYTSPIKALSNQKYRDFKQTFSSASVGILTGDVQINPEASCLIMTTEILRSMLYKGADLIRDVEFVIFDEVHYVNDAERGVVWEEVIIMLPDHVNIILLSATVPNTKEFADWVGRTKKKDIYVISTAKRPVPLEHYLYAGRQFHKIVDSSGNFLSDGYKAAAEALRRKQDKEREAAGLPPVQRLGRAAAPQRGGLLPVVIFTFSKKRCEENAGTLNNADLCTAVEKSEIHVAIEKALSRLKDVDRRLPQIRRMRDLLGRGIGVHHGGLLPIVKEVVELLFARGLVKVLFATETFAMGVNMPTRCVVFSHIRKHDGRSFREVLAGEYTQMAGRAGRRGLDTTGTVIIVANDELPEQTTLIGVLTGKPAKLQSQFRLTYNMILNLLRVEALRVEEMIKRSFSENASQRLLPDQMKQVVKNEAILSRLQKLSCEHCLPDIEKYYDDTLDVIEYNYRLLATDNNRRHRGSKQLLQPGRVVVLNDGHFRWKLGAIVRPGTTPIVTSGVVEKVALYDVVALVDMNTKLKKIDDNVETLPPIWPPEPSMLTVENDVTHDLRTVPLTSIALVTDKVVKLDLDNIALLKLRAFASAVTTLQGVLDGWVSNGHISEINWHDRIHSLEFQETVQARERLLKRIPTYKCVKCPEFKEHYEIKHGEKVLRAKIENLKMSISEQNLELIPDYEQRIAVLKELKFIDDNSTVLLKGRVACEVCTYSHTFLVHMTTTESYRSTRRTSSS